MVAEGELRSNLDDSDRVRELQDKVAELKAEVCIKLNTAARWSAFVQSTNARNPFTTYPDPLLHAYFRSAFFNS